MIGNMKNLLFFFLIISFPSFALAHSISEEKATLLKVKKRYDNEINKCQTLENRVLKTIEDPWLKNLEKHRQAVILKKLNNAAFIRCIKSNEQQFTYNLMEYTAKTGDQLFLNSWLMYKTALYQNDAKLVLSEDEQKEYKRLSSLPLYYYPFSMKKSSFK